MSTIVELEDESQNQFYLVRTLPELIEKGIVGVGWVDFHFNEIPDAEEALRLIVEDWGSVGRWSNQIRRFYNIAEGDVVVAPVPYAVAIGKATGGLFYDTAYYDADRANQRRVNFPRDQEGRVITIPRTSFSEAFQRRLQVQGMTVNDLGEFAAEIQSAVVSLEQGSNYSWVNQIHEETSRQKEVFKKKLLVNIQSGKTNLQTGGVGLENLVCELLNLEGYSAHVLSKRHFGSFADADVQASRSDRCTMVKLFVQVKHHQGFSNEDGIHQLEEIRNAHAGEYDDYEHVFVTSASVSEELRKTAEKSEVTVIAGPELAEWLSDHIHRLSNETKLALGVYEVPAVI
jgi:restriction system protein